MSFLWRERSIKRRNTVGRGYKYHTLCPDIVPTALMVKLRLRSSDLPEDTKQSIQPALNEAKSSDSTSDSDRGLAV